MNKKIMGINIWDDYYEDNNIPNGEIQETYLYIESVYDKDVINEEEFLSGLSLLIKTFLCDDNININLFYYNSKVMYPNLPERFTFVRWQINLEHLTHIKRVKLLKYLNDLNLTYEDYFIYFYSES